MRSAPRNRLLALAALSVLALQAAPARAAEPGCARAPAANAQVLEAMGRWYQALRTDDPAAFAAETTPDFKAFDGGGVYPGVNLSAAVKAAHAAGKIFTWSMDDPQVRIDCHTAWVTYVNHGAVTTAAGTKPVVWLESAVLVLQAGRWRLAFFHSSPASPAG